MATAVSLNALSEQVIGSSIAVHKALGPGLLENAYEACLEFELRDRGFRVERQKPLPVFYRDVRVDCGFRIDLNHTSVSAVKSHVASLHLMCM